MWRRPTLVLCTALVLVSWGICVLSYATQGGGEYSGVFVIFIAVAAALTVWAGMLVVRGWRGEGSVLAAPPVSVLAGASILWLAVAIGLRG